MKDYAFRELIGRRIQHVVYSSGKRDQVFLVFDDGTAFEFWGTQFSCASGLDGGGLEATKEHAGHCGRTVKVYSGPDGG